MPEPDNFLDRIASQLLQASISASGRWTAFNTDTGELLVFTADGEWTKPQLAENPKTGERLYFDGTDWRPVPITNGQYRAAVAASALLEARP